MVLQRKKIDCDTACDISLVYSKGPPSIMRCYLAHRSLSYGLRGRRNLAARPARRRGCRTAIGVRRRWPHAVADWPNNRSEVVAGGVDTATRDTRHSDAPADDGGVRFPIASLHKHRAVIACRVDSETSIRMS
ncbi:hypothetical protein EVAR_62611_1 [Eumeta japonica]|uniref:Uncharacterized protein n=1 Tax=Eumeta variegata TaxID=151549 RepID=A0A4C1ZEV4_EUMVA|nr:hypothetical protein EVAR_62611_1 [Eumeta japonica]